MDKKKFKREGKRSNKDGIKLKKRKLLENEKLTEQIEDDQTPVKDKFGTDGKKTRGRSEKKINGILKIKKRRQEKGGVNDTVKVVHTGLEIEGVEMVMESNQSENQSIMKNDAKAQESDLGSEIITKKSRKSSKKKKDRQLQINTVKPLEGRTESTEHVVYDMSSEDEDCSKGMKKWIMEYHQSRPGVKELLDTIDEFITAYEEEQEKARKEKESSGDEWVLVERRKGRKKTADSESGLAVGSAAQAAPLDEQVKKKKHKDVDLGFYRNQRKEAQINEIMMLQSKFELDKKRIQQLRAARKFKPY